jgi:hypothetical protein
MSSVAAIWRAVVSDAQPNKKRLLTTTIGPPFHTTGQRPKAPCPACVKEKGDSEPRDLFSIRGFNKDEYDPQIPPAWFTAPPIRLDGSGKEMEALRVRQSARKLR